jgi:glucose-1-phosphate thymidylyltransferase
MSDNLKIVIPTAGWATRLRPQTWSKPKPLFCVAGRTSLDHLLGSFSSLPDLETGEKGHPERAEYVIILGPYLGETQVPIYMQEHYPDYRVNYIVQPRMSGQSDALWHAREYLSGPILVCFSDTLIETDFSFLTDETADGVAWVKEVPDPRRFGVAELDSSGWVTRLIEKPTSLENTQVVVGCYYFREGVDLVAAIEEQKKTKRSLNGEFYLVEAINIMLERGMKMHTFVVDSWLDTGTIEAILSTNRYLLQHGCSNGTVQNTNLTNVKIVPPVFIHPNARIVDSTIGPHVSIGEGCQITDSLIEDSILESGVTLKSMSLKGSFIGRDARILGHSAVAKPMILNVGDNSSILLD